jgi:hypothetical protein
LHVNGSVVEFLEPRKGKVALIFIEELDAGHTITVQADEVDNRNLYWDAVG